MLRVLLPVLILIATVYAVVECIQTEDREVRNLPKLIWILLIVLAPPIGAIAWFIAGRPQSILPGGGPGGAGGPGRPGGPTRGAGRTRPSAPRGPDDDPDFLRGL